MRIQGGRPRLSASDLASHLGCRHLTALDLEVAHGRLKPPLWRDPALEVLQQRGLQHEAEYLDHLRRRGLTPVVVSTEGDGSAFDATVAAMRDGAELIVQATLSDGDWYGRADILRRVPAESALGAWSYEVIDTKLARETRAGAILQLCLYSDIVRAVQGRLPNLMHVVSPGVDFEPETFRVSDYLAYYRLVKARLATVVIADADARRDTYPDPVPQCDVCRWWAVCDRRRHEDDHLSLVAGISKLQRRELMAWGVETLTALAKLPLPLERRPSHGTADGYVQVREQARVQLEGRQRREPVYELLPASLNVDSRVYRPLIGDIFFDIEGDPFVGLGGMEYLLGWVSADDKGSPEYHALWATNREQERTGFEAFVDEVMACWGRHPDLHIYHYAPYEPAAMKRLMGRYASREDEVDRMLRAGLFIDLHSITKQTLRASVERYSIKDLEQFYGYEREVALREASQNLRAFERALELGESSAAPNDIRIAVEKYNRDDCVSTLKLRNWLEEIRSDLTNSGEDIPRPTIADGAPSESVDERQQRVLSLMDRLLGDVPAERDERSEAQHAVWLIAHMLDWHRREEKAPWWEYFRLAELGEEELLNENNGLAGLEFSGRFGGSDRCPVHRYRFPAQDTDISEDDALRYVGGEPLGSVVAIDTQARTIDIKKRSDTVEIHPGGVYAHSIVTGKEQAEALFRLGDWIAANDVDAPGSNRAARDLLLCRAPRLLESVPTGAKLQREGESSLDAARRLVAGLDDGVLAIQGPPGAGKTHTGARMICELVRAGKKVGITAVSHKVIRYLLDGVVAAAGEEGLAVRCIQKVAEKPAKYEGQPIRETMKNEVVFEALADGDAQIAAGIAWLWAREELFQAVDVLFVDEAGQMSLANVLAVAQAARNIVLLGDPQQLDQPLQGSHPEGTEVSALQHLLADRQTIPSDRGLFLAETWRLHPSISAFTSELFYEGRLRSRPDLGNQAIVGSTPFTGAGLWFIPVEHEGNQNRSPEEVERVAELHASLVSSNLSWINRDGVEAAITERDILIVAPYNAQVGALGERLPTARIGTVDKFQGQEAPIVIYSMATSSPEEAPRGMEFLFSLNRLNVATSRARCCCILVANPHLFEPECRTPRQIQLANAFCRYLELAKRA